MTRIPHIMIMASAGSGKTYALTNRFVQLLADGAEPERIVALTFTRKAAGEFFDEILQKLARAARDETSARRLAAEVERPGLRAGDFLRLLRRMVDAMHRLRLGTLDSFFARIARAFPLELGLAGEFEILQEHAARVERRRVLRRMFARSSPSLEAAQSEFIEAFKRATFGAEEKQLGSRLDEFLDEHQENFLAAPDQARWGEANRIWPQGSPWLAAEIKVSEAVRDLRAALTGLTDGQRVRWEGFFAAIGEWRPGAPLPPAVEYILKNSLSAWRELCDGRAEITVERRKLVLAPGACGALERIIRQVIGAELRRRLEMTRGIHAVLRAYETHYHDAVRRVGRLTFADVQRLLRPDAGAPVLSGRASLPRPALEDEGPAAMGQLGLPLGDEGPSDPGDALAPERAVRESAEERRLAIDYRLDAEIDHWLLDEFQDTSYGQWSVLRNLIDEVVQDAEGARSFFCVGDVKQAIYAWREGDPRLFREIFDHYNQSAGGVIEERHLLASWRSGPDLIAMVNAVFGAPAVLAELFPGPASATWNREWRDHSSAVPERTGQAALLHAVDERDRWATTRRLLEELRPLERGLTCAVLVKRNDTAAALADELRRAGISAIAESDLHVATDNPVGAALLALVQAAAHPGDTLAREHVAMTPLGEVLAAEGVTTPAALVMRVLERIHAHGFERGLEPWIAALEDRFAPDDGFSRRRAREFMAAARLFDGTGSRDVDEFIAFMERHAVRPPETAAVVRVMTVHKSKGLGFDLVVVPDLQGNRIDERRGGLAVQKAADRSVDWILDLPPKLFCGMDDVLAAHLRAAEAEAAYENLSLLYVALTRAKRGLYVVIEPPGESTSRNFPRLLTATLGDEPREVRVGGAAFPGAWASGDPEWAVKLAPAADEAPGDRAKPLAPIAGRAVPRAPRRVALRPSARWSGAGVASSWFQLAKPATEYGSELHAMLAQVEWAEPAEAVSWAERWRREGRTAALITTAAGCLRNPRLAHVWRRPKSGEQAEVWRERSFEIVLDGAWVTGVFDRVRVERGADGRVRRADVFDFKTDRAESPAEMATAMNRHREQIDVYRRVAAVFTGLPAASVGCELVFTQPGRAMALE